MANKDHQRDQLLFSIIGDNPSKVFRTVRKLKNIDSGTNNLAYLRVKSKTYYGDNVADGFYDSLSSLKQCDESSLLSNPCIKDKFLDYSMIMDICKSNNKALPEVNLEQSTSILQRMKKSVRDHYNITPLHFINAGETGLFFFNFLINAVIRDINNACVDELNRAHAIILYKGHQKDRNSDRSYRCISTCPPYAL